MAADEIEGNDDINSLLRRISVPEIERPEVHAMRDLWRIERALEPIDDIARQTAALKAAPA